ncbi:MULTISPECIES: aldo/keto reductase [unclassified Meiothermus]|uniref:aldo/keto reductase n=1 Tax=unclassified Meiothermus TaxID=370471 RepID=UPI000D7CED7F|nr:MULTISPECIES: aldo/keto reductase [unclassified Meiothermus]PZA08167.1 aldo/keto reductase [Meiothermus sp. Pnk-1]RYM32680.1 aldo/keto reductase [Meiothermus sp. PNK-Is4]
MSYRRLGRSGLFVYPIALGTMQFGWTADEATAQEVMDAFVEMGGTLIDTADIYTNWAAGNPGGVSEEIIGRWMKSRGNRERVVIATKVRGPMGPNGSEGRGHPLQREGLSRKWILRAAEDSLRRLQTDYIDLYQVHWVDNQVPIEETLSALSDLVRRGWVRYIGASNFSAWRLMQALWAADKYGYESFISLQPEYSLTQPTRANFEREIARVCETYGIGVIPYSPLAGGFLTGKYRRDQPLPESVRAQEITNRRYSEQNWAILDKVLELARQRGIPPAQVALAWLLAKPYVSAPIVGANSVAQLRELMPAASLQLSREEVAALDQVSDWPRSRTEREV